MRNKLSQMKMREKKSMQACWHHGYPRMQPSLKLSLSFPFPCVNIYPLLSLGHFATNRGLSTVFSPFYKGRYRVWEVASLYLWPQCNSQNWDLIPDLFDLKAKEIPMIWDPLPLPMSEAKELNYIADLQAITFGEKETIRRHRYRPRVADPALMATW